MAEQTMLVCDTCGRPAAETVTIRSSRGNRQRDYCSEHLDELLATSRVPRRGRRPGSARSAAPRKRVAKRSTAKKSTAKKSTAKRLSRRKAGTRRKPTKSKRA